ncbi:MAG: hypothetical protein ACFCBW_13565 [Candidatus Competibacterales bacterium]
MGMTPGWPIGLSGALLAVGAVEGVVAIEGTPLPLAAEATAVACIDANRALLATAAGFETWSLATLEPLARTPDPLPNLIALEVAPDAGLALGVTPQSAVIYDLADGHSRAERVPGGTTFVDATLSPEGDSVALGLRNGQLILWQWRDDIAQALEADEFALLAVDGDPQGWVSVGTTGTVKRWSPAGELLGEFTIEVGVGAVVAAHGERLIHSGGRWPGFCRFTLPLGQSLGCLDSPEAAPYAASLALEGTMVLGGGAQGNLALSFDGGESWRTALAPQASPGGVPLVDVELCGNYGLSVGEDGAAVRWQVSP